MQSCQELTLSLDLSGASHHNLTLQVKDCGQVRVANIKSGQDSHREHQLNIHLQDVDKFIIEKQSIEEALTVRPLYQDTRIRAHYFRSPAPVLVRS